MTRASPPNKTAICKNGRRRPGTVIGAASITSPTKPASTTSPTPPAPPTAVSGILVACADGPLPALPPLPPPAVPPPAALLPSPPPPLPPLLRRRFRRPEPNHATEISDWCKKFIIYIIITMLIDNRPEMTCATAFERVLSSQVVRVSLRFHGPVAKIPCVPHPFLCFTTFNSVYIHPRPSYTRKFSTAREVCCEYGQSRIVRHLATWHSRTGPCVHPTQQAAKPRIKILELLSHAGSYSPFGRSLIVPSS